MSPPSLIVHLHSSTLNLPCTHKYRTHPTVYVAYPTPVIILNTLNKNSVCDSDITAIPLPDSYTTQFIFPSADKSSPTPGIDEVFSFLDQQPVVTSLVHGDPRTCRHGGQVPQFFTTPIIGFDPLVHTTVSVLTEVGAAVTLAADPFNQDPGANPPPGGGGTAETPGIGTPAPTGAGQPQTEETPGGSPASPVTFNGATITPVGSGAIVVNGQTISQGSTGTIGNGVPVSVGSGGVVVVGSSSFTIPTRPASSSSASSSGGIGQAIASGIGAIKNNAFVGGKATIIAFEASVLALVFGCIGIL
jgi:hypothetical protein